MGRLTSLKPSLSRLLPALGKLAAADPGYDRQREANAPWRKWYKTARWRALRLRVFARDLFQCQCGCGVIEGNTSLLVADHKTPHRGDERKFWDETNIQTMRKPCHDTLKQKQEQASLHQRGVWD